MSRLTIEAIKAASTRAKASGHLFGIDTDPLVVRELGLEFVVRKLTSLAKKQKVTNSTNNTFTNPFLPYDPAMFVKEVGTDHVCLLNKFNVVDNHILCVTKEFHHQSVQLSANDFDAWLECLRAVDGIGFFNCGPNSGASQPHKHMQIVPERSALLTTLVEGHPTDNTLIQHSPLLPFAHAFIRLTCDVTGTVLQSLYTAMASQLGITLLTAADPELLARDIRAYPIGFTSYNLLLTNDMLFMVPRSNEKTQTTQEIMPEMDGVQDVKLTGLSINALGYAGLILTKSEEEREDACRRGLLTCLKEVSVTP